MFRSYNHIPSEMGERGSVFSCFGTGLVRHPVALAGPQDAVQEIAGACGQGRKVIVEG
jgi:hypothetical protein